MATAGDPARLLFERTDRFVCTLDLQGRFTSINPAGTAISGYSAEELIGRYANELIVPEQREIAAERFAARLAGNPSDETEYFLLRRDGTRIAIAIASTLIEQDGKATGVLGIVSDLSEQNRTSDALLESERRFRGSFESASIGMALVAPDGRFLEINPAFCELVGYSTDEMTSRGFQQITHPDDLARDLENVQRTLDGDFDSYQMEKRYIRSDGSEVWVTLSVTLVRGADGAPLHFVAHAQDIDARKRADERFVAAERRYRTLVEQLPLCMYIRSLDMSQPNIYVSPQVEKILGYPVSDWLEDPDLVKRIMHPDDQERVLGEAARVRRGAGSFAEEYRYVKPDGTVVWVQDEMHLVRGEQGEPLYVQGFVRDITERKLTEAERDRLRDELLHAQRLEAIGRLAGGVAHDFNNMLTAIRGYAELLVGDANAPGSTRENARRIVQATEQAADLPRQLLAFGRRQVLEPAIVNLNDVVSSIRGLLEHVSGAITVDIAPTAANPWALADRSQLEHALVNLALNASDAMPSGGAIEVSTANITIDEHDAAEPEARPGSYVVIRVTDTGIGMDDETRRRAFEPFFTTKTEKEGSGLGLSSVHGTVAQSGGFVLLETEVGVGTTFSLYLPVAAASVEARPRTILLAEDEAIVRDLTEQILKNAGYDVLTAGDGAEALVLYEEHRGEIDGVVTDIVMPGLGGRGLARQIREHDAELPIVFISGHHEETPETLQLGTGAALLQKPFSVDALVGAVGRLVGEDTTPVPVELERAPTCVLADDHPAVLDSVSRFLETRGMRVSQARDGEQALATIRATQPDVAILDVAMSPTSGIDIARHVADVSPQTKVILYTGHNDRGLLDRALDAGARGFVLKEGTLESLEEAVRTVAEGGTWVDSRLATAVASPETVSSLPPLTPREREILGLVANGLTNDKVATSLAISPETVQSHVRHAMVKLEADTRTEAVATALRHSLIS
ncbi:MAG TPA: PAS domain S-box protein [Gaiellaceae bacterium]|nr:PAS domain S-box protein [Gaiellaceae bacterium]